MGVIHPDITMAETLPSRFYTDEGHYTKLLEKFSQSWILVGHISMLDDDNVIPIQIGNTPMLVTKTGEMIHCVSNVCTHRGMILSDKITSVSKILCPYHGRSFTLCGKLRHMPKFSEVANFPSSADNLPATKVVNWHGLLFVNLSDDTPFDDYMADVTGRMNFLDFSRFEKSDSLDRVHDIEANWLLYVDNYLEGFHIPYVHKGLNSIIDYSNYETEVFSNAVLQVGYASDGDICFELPKHHPDFGKDIAAYYWWLFPNLMLNFYPWGLSVNVVLPKGLTSTRVLYYGLVYDESKFGAGAGGDLDTVEDEDQWIVEACNKGMQSEFYDRGRYSPSMEKGVHHFHRLLTE